MGTKNMLMIYDKGHAKKLIRPERTPECKKKHTFKASSAVLYRRGGGGGQSNLCVNMALLPYSAQF